MRSADAVGAVLALTLAPVTAGCACTQLAGAAGIDVSLPGALQREARRAEVEVCSDDGCQRSTVRVDDSVSASLWVPLDGRDVELTPGAVSVEVTLTGAGRRVLARHEDTVELVASQPEGAACDGDEWPRGTLVVPETSAERPGESDSP